MRSDVEVRTQREEPGTNKVSSNGIRDIQISSSHSGSYEIEIIIGGSPIRTITRDTIPQSDGPSSAHATGRALESVRSEQEITQRPMIMPRGGYPDESDSDSNDNRRPHKGRRPPGRRRYQERSGRPPDRENSSQDKGPSGRGRPLDRNGGPPYDGGPPDNGGPLMVEDPLMMEDPLMVEDPLEMDKIQVALEDKDHQAHQDLLDQYTLL